MIDPSVDMRSSVTLGVGNVILGHAYIGPCSSIGDNNFISAHVSLEHGNVLTSHCAFGPAVYTSGNVTIGSNVRFGTGIFVEPNVSIGSRAIIGSGQTIVADVPADALRLTRSTL